MVAPKKSAFGEALCSRVSSTTSKIRSREGKSPELKPSEFVMYQPFEETTKERIIGIGNELRPVPSARACSSCFIPDPTSLCSVRSSIFYSMLHPRPNLTSFG
ncbi:hypothetical protein E4T56_gene14483 [Termitomyces sp. T112]|nr:hypothetical protein E4T56_gene14483 [Termitomyces sp. T112]